MRSSGNSRGRLLEAAIEVIEREGEAALRVDAVAEKAGVTKPSIYHFFHDRDGLIVAAQAERYYRSLFIGVRQLDLDALLGTASHDEYIEMLRATFLAAMSTDGVEQRRVRAQALGSAVTRPALRAAILEVHREVVATLTRVLAHGQERGWLRSDFSPSALSSWWFGISAGRHLVEEYSEYADAAAWPAIVWSTVAHLTGLPLAPQDSAPPTSTDATVR